MKVVTINEAEEKEEFIVHKHMIEFGKMHYVQMNKHAYLLVGLNKETLTMEDIRFLGGETRKRISDYSCEKVMVDFQRLISQCKGFSEKEVVTAFLEGWYLGGYAFLFYKKERKRLQPTLQFDSDDVKEYAKTAEVRANAVNIARDLCNEPANKLTPTIYAERLKSLFRQSKVSVEIIETDDLKERGFNATSIVGKGSNNPPKVAVLTMKNSEKNHVALVGKGVTFDSGGTNVKTGKDIGEMKMDMGGSAAVVGAMKLLSDLDSPVHVTAILPLVTNVSGGNAFLPSDVINYSNGLTVEVGNTDAEGRLVLADGILHAQSLGATTIIDIATLTGTIGQALGLKLAGIFSNYEEGLWLYKELGDHTGDYVWPMPVVNDYQAYLSSDCADLNNMSTSSFGGAITAALFLKNFVEEGTKWVHIDMANTVRPWKEQGYYVPGASGFGVRLLTEIIQAEDE